MPPYIEYLEEHSVNAHRKRRTKSVCGILRLMPRAIILIEYCNKDRPLLVWREEVDKFVSEFIRLDGRGDFAGQDLCGRCSMEAPAYRCVDCATEELFCKACTVAFHAYNPFHIIEVRGFL